MPTCERCQRDSHGVGGLDGITMVGIKKRPAAVVGFDAEETRETFRRIIQQLAGMLTTLVLPELPDSVTALALFHTVRPS